MNMNHKAVTTRLVSERKIKNQLQSVTIECVAPYNDRTMVLSADEILVVGRGQDLTSESGGMRFIHLYICDERMSEYLCDDQATVIAPIQMDVQFEREDCDSIAQLTEQIVEWADDVIPHRRPTSALTKMVMEEIPELIISDHDPLEVADVGILFLDYCHLNKINLGEVILQKMEINRNRKWLINADTGLLSHDEE